MPAATRYLILVLLIALSGSACSDMQSTADSSVQTAADAAASSAPLAPAWELADAEGTKVEFGGPRDKPAVVFFWASWCPYCKQLMPHLQSIKDQHGDQIEILALNIFEDDDPQALLDEYGFEFRLVPAADGVAPLYGVKGTPGLFLIDTDGRVRYDLTQVEIDKAIPEDIKRWQKAARLAPLWAARLREAVARL